MLRMIGAIMILAASAGVGYCFSAAEGGRVRQIEGFLLLLRHIRNGIVTYASPVEEIYSRFENTALETCGFLPALRTGGFAHALHTRGAYLYLDGEEKRTLLSFAQGVGQSYTSEQAALCDYTVTELERMLSLRRREAPRRARAAQTLSVCGGLLVLLLLG